MSYLTIKYISTIIKSYFQVDLSVIRTMVKKHEKKIHHFTITYLLFNNYIFVFIIYNYNSKERHSHIENMVNNY